MKNLQIVSNRKARQLNLEQAKYRIYNQYLKELGMSIVIVDTDFVVHKEDEEWTTEEIKMIEEHLLEEQSAQYQVKREVPKQFYADIAERLLRGDLTAWEQLDG